MTAPPERCRRVILADPDTSEAAPLFSVSWSPDGTQLAFAHFHGVSVAPADGGDLRPLAGGWASGVCWSSDGRRVAGAFEDGAVVVWSADGGDELFRDPVTGRSPPRPAWSPDGQSLLWAPQRLPPTLCLAQAPRFARRALAEPGGTVIALAWSPDGSRLAVGLTHPRSTFAAVLRADSGERLVTAPLPYIHDLAWSPDGRRIAVATVADPVILLDATTGQRLLAAGGQGGTARTVAWAPSGHWFAFDGPDGAVRVCSEDGREVLCLRGHQNTVQSVAFSPSGTTLASASVDGTLRLWDVSDLAPARPEPPAAPERAYLHRQALSVGRRPRHPAPADPWVPRLEGADDAAGSLGGLANAGRCVALSPDGRAVFTLGTTRPLRRWDLTTGQLVWERPPEQVTSSCELAVSPDGSMLAVACAAYSDRVVDAATGKVLWQGDSHKMIKGVDWSPQGDRLACAAVGSIAVRQATTGRLLMDLREDGTDFFGVAWSPDGEQLAAATHKGEVRVWSSTGQSLQALNGHTMFCWGVAWSPDGRWLASLGEDGAVVIWEPGSWREAARCLGPTTPQLLRGVAWSPDSRLVASCGFDPFIRVWDALTGREVHRYQGCGKYLWSLRWSRSGAFLVSGGGDGVHLWDARPLMRPTAAPPASAPADGAPPALSALPADLARLARLGQAPPLGLLRDALALAAGRPAGALAPLAAHPGAAALADLRWPAPARLGLVALLLRRCAYPAEWSPPPGLPHPRLRDALAAALADADDAPPAHYPAPLPPIEAALIDVDERLLGLLALVGPQAVAADPSLPLRLLPHARVAPPAIARARLAPALGGGPTAPRPGPWGVGRSALGTRGDWRSLLPWQLTLPADVLAAKQRRGELLFRCGEAREGGTAGPLVLVLDVSPASYGPVEAVTRACAAACAQAWQARGEAVWLVTAGGVGQARELRSPADLAAVWLARSARPPRSCEALRAADRLRRGLAGAGPGCVLLLAHAHFGWGEEAPELSPWRALFVHHPGRRPAPPPWSPACRRWAACPAGDPDAGLAALAEVLT